jgi:hypothetical protein
MMPAIDASVESDKIRSFARGTKQQTGLQFVQIRLLDSAAGG